MYLSKPKEDTLFIGTTFLEAFLIRLDADGGQEVGDVVGRRVFVAAEGMHTGQFIYCGKKAQLAVGNVMPIGTKSFLVVNYFTND